MTLEGPGITVTIDAMFPQSSKYLSILLSSLNTYPDKWSWLHLGIRLVESLP
jgi:hypothetical protein